MESPAFELPAITWVEPEDRDREPEPEPEPEPEEHPMEVDDHVPVLPILPAINLPHLD